MIPNLVLVQLVRWWLGGVTFLYDIGALLRPTRSVSSRMESVEIGLDTYTADTIAAHKKIRQVTVV